MSGLHRCVGVGSAIASSTTRQSAIASSYFGWAICMNCMMMNKWSSWPTSMCPRAIVRIQPFANCFAAAGRRLSQHAQARASKHASGHAYVFMELCQVRSRCPGICRLARRRMRRGMCPCVSMTCVSLCFGYASLRVQRCALSSGDSVVRRGVPFSAQVCEEVRGHVHFLV